MRPVRSVISTVVLVLSISILAACAPGTESSMSAVQVRTKNGALPLDNTATGITTTSIVQPTTTTNPTCQARFADGVLSWCKAASQWIITFETPRGKAGFISGGYSSSNGGNNILLSAPAGATNIVMTVAFRDGSIYMDVKVPIGTSEYVSMGAPRVSQTTLPSTTLPAVQLPCEVMLNFPVLKWCLPAMSWTYSLVIGDKVADPVSVTATDTYNGDQIAVFKYVPGVTAIIVSAKFHKVYFGQPEIVNLRVPAGGKSLAMTRTVSQ